jgi:Cu(I)/Ag(I) efflux system membrane fusion protein
VQAEGQKLATSLQAVEAASLEGEAAQKWTALNKALQADVMKLNEANDLGASRNAFPVLSDDMAAAVEAFGANEKLYKQYCPMANNSQGAIWLSSSQEIRNPYYGDAMLECGEVQVAIQKK